MQSSGWQYMEATSSLKSESLLGIYWIIPIVVVKGAILAFLTLSVAEASFSQAIIITVISAILNGTILYLVQYLTAKRVSDKAEEVKEHVDKTVHDAVEKENNG